MWLGAAVALGLVVLLAGVHVAVGWLDQWRSGFFDAGSSLLAYNLLRCLLLVLLALACRGAGAWFELSSLRPLDAYIVGSVAGFSTYTLVGYGLALAGLLSPWTALVAFCLGLVATSRCHREFRAAVLSLRSTGWGAKAVLGLAVFFGLALLLSRGLSVGLGTMNDYGHYLPTYESIRQSGRLDPLPTFFSFFYLKGAGFGHLVVAVSDTISVQLAGVLTLFWLGLIAYRLGLLLTAGNAAISGLAALLVVPAFAGVEMEKTHAPVSLLMMAVLHGFALRFIDRSEDRSRRAGTLFVVALACIAPTAVPFLVVLLGGLLASGCLSRDRDLVRTAVFLAAVATIAALIQCGIAFAVTGLPDVTPLREMLLLRDDSRLSEWNSVVWIRLYMMVLDATPAGSQFSELAFTSMMGGRAAVDLAVLLLLPLGAVVWRSLDRPEVGRLDLLLPIPALGLLAYTHLLTLIMPGRVADLQRFAVYAAVLWPTVYLSVGSIVLDGLRRLAYRASGEAAPARWGRVEASWFALLAGPLLFQAITPISENQSIAWRAVAALGYASFAEQYAPLDDATCYTLARQLPAGTRVMVLEVQPVCAVVPNIKGEMGGFPTISREAETALYASPDRAAEVYRRYGLRHFVFYLQPGYFTDVYPPAFSPLFAPESIASRFRIRHVVGSGVLLILDGTDADGTIPTEDFVRRYAARLDQARMSPGAVAYRRMAEELAAGGPPPSLFGRANRK